MNNLQYTVSICDTVLTILEMHASILLCCKFPINEKQVDIACHKVVGVGNAT